MKTSLLLILKSYIGKNVGVFLLSMWPFTSGQKKVVQNKRFPAGFHYHPAHFLFRNKTAVCKERKSSSDFYLKHFLRHQLNNCVKEEQNQFCLFLVSSWWLSMIIIFFFLTYLSHHINSLCIICVEKMQIYPTCIFPPNIKVLKS